MTEAGRVDDLFSARRKPGPTESEPRGCRRKGCTSIPPGGICFFSEASLLAYIGEQAKAVHEAEVRSMLNWSARDIEARISRIALKRGLAAAKKLQLAIDLAKQRKQEGTR